MKEYISKSLDETKNLAKIFLDSIYKIAPKGESSLNHWASVVSLNGDLGSGKTTFTKAVAGILGINETVTSPTFVIMKKYKITKYTKYPFKNLIHIDAYRLSGAKDLKAIDFDNLIRESGNLIFIEWAENIKDGLKGETKEIIFEFVDENTRKITF